eukprot:gene14205-16331_t
MNIGRTVDESSWFGRLREAAKNGDTQIIQTIFSKSAGESINSQDINGNSALMLGAEEGHTDVVRMLLNNHQVNSKLEDKAGWTALMCATSKNNCDIVKLLLDHEDTELHMANLHKNRALRSASEKGYSAIVKMLLTSSGVDVNLPNMHGRTALMYAAQSGHTETVQALLASPNIGLHIRDQVGRTALDLAGNEEIKGLFRNRVTHAVPITTSTRAVSSCWLPAHLEHSGFDPVVVKDCVQKLVHQEGFVSEADFAECSTTDINKAYLVDIGVQGLGLQQHLLKLHSELHALYTQQTAPTSPHQVSLSAGPAVGRQPFICTPEKPPPTHSLGSVSGYSSLGPSVFDCEAGAVFGEGSVCHKRDRAEASMEDSVPAHMYVPMHKGSF